MELVKVNVGTCVFTVLLILPQFQVSMKYQVNFFFLNQKGGGKAHTDTVKIGANFSHAIPGFHAENEEQMALSTLFGSGY